jgi:rod shape-determining protein MreD
MSRQRSPALVYWGSITIALLLALLPLPDPLRPFKPFWLALVVIYFALEAPERMSLGRAFLLGLAGDLLSGSLLGEQALRLVIMAFVVLRLRARMRFFPISQQTFAVLALLLNDRVVLLMVRAFAREGVPDWSFWMGPLTGALLWPWIFIALDSVRLKSRVRPT